MLVINGTCINSTCLHCVGRSPRGPASTPREYKRGKSDSPTAKIPSLNLRILRWKSSRLFQVIHLDSKVVDSTLTYMHAGLQHHIVFKHKLDCLMSSTVPIALAWLTHRLHAREIQWPAAVAEVTAEYNAAAVTADCVLPKGFQGLTLSQLNPRVELGHKRS